MTNQEMIFNRLFSKRDENHDKTMVMNNYVRFSGPSASSFTVAIKLEKNGSTRAVSLDPNQTNPTSADRTGQMKRPLRTHTSIRTAGMWVRGAGWCAKGSIAFWN